MRGLLLALCLLWAGPALACSAPEGFESFAASVIDKTNALRASKNRRALRADPKLAAAAQAHACFLASTGKLSHTGAGGSDVGQRILAEGYRWRSAAENVAFGATFPADVVRQWERSPGHRSNMLNKRVREIGIGMAMRGPTPFWVMVLARSR